MDTDHLFPPMACSDCGDPEGRNGLDATCRNHEDFVECGNPACGAVYPLIEGATYVDESDPSVGLFGLTFECPACAATVDGEVPEPDYITGMGDATTWVQPCTRWTQALGVDFPASAEAARGLPCLFCGDVWDNHSEEARTWFLPKAIDRDQWHRDAIRAAGDYVRKHPEMADDYSDADPGL